MKAVTDKTLPDTGERMIPAHHKGGMVYGEHVVRYEAVLPLVKGKTVLDVASGSGYGSALIGTTAKNVIGVDIDGPTVKYATKNYGSKTVSFLKGDGVAIPLEDNSVDVVVSFETIEHIEDYQTFMIEVKRVLKDDGLLILSTPNDVEFIEGNHFHIHEFEYQELADLVAKFFKNMKPYFQATWFYNAVIDEKLLTTEWRQPLDTLNTAPIDPTKAIYFMMLCSNRKITETIEPVGAISQHFSERTTREQDMKLHARVEELEGAAAQHQTMINEKDVKLNEIYTELSNITGSRAWQIVSQIRRLKHMIKPSK